MSAATAGDVEAVTRGVTAHLARAARFRAFALGLEYPSADVRREIERRWRELAAQSDAAAGPAAGIAAALAALAATDPEELEAGHVRLFGPAGTAPLTETSYGDPGRLLGKAAALADLGGFYRAFGVLPGSRHARPEDHLALELEFASLLALKEAWAFARGDEAALLVTGEAARKFFAEHLGTWLDAWSAGLDAAAPPAFYGCLGALVRDAVRAECARLGAEPVVLAARAVDREVGGEALSCPRAGDSPHPA
ncbi:MAG: molecular chaperone TorD family protein [Myxococcales bacterium]|jgi:TorA maturation chaperone TorD|nr:molecular chaperone TorD family protein [Myxococcales bacterium]